MKKLLSIVILMLIVSGSFAQLGGGGKGYTKAQSDEKYPLKTDNSAYADYLVNKIGATYYAKSNIKSAYTSYSNADVTVVLQSAINALTSGGVIHISRGLYDNMDSIRITNNNITIQGDGMYNTTLKLKASYDVGHTWISGFIWLLNSTNTTFRNIGIDCNFANQTRKDDGNTGNGFVAQIRGICGTHTTAGNPDYPSYLTVDNCYIVGATRHGIGLSRTDKAVIRNSHIKDSGWNNIMFEQGCTNCIAENNLIEGGGDVGICMQGINNMSRGNIIQFINGSNGDGNTRWGIEFMGDGVTGVSRNNHAINNKIIGVRKAIGGDHTRDCTIEGNTIDSVTIGAIQLDLDSGSYITNNRIRRFQYYGIELNGCTRTQVSNNNLATKYGISGMVGIMLNVSGATNSTYNLIDGNYVYPTKPTGDVIGMQFVGAASNNIVKNNVFRGLYKEYDFLNSSTATGTILVNNWGVTTGGWLNTTGMFNTTATATVGGLTTGILAEGNQNVTVTSSNAAYIVCLPAIGTATIGTKVTGRVGANGFELRVAASQISTSYLNNVTTSVEAAIPANSSFEVTCIDATHWILKAWTALGAPITAIVPDAN